MAHVRIDSVTTTLTPSTASDPLILDAGPDVTFPAVGVSPDGYHRVPKLAYVEVLNVDGAVTDPVYFTVSRGDDANDFDPPDDPIIGGGGDTAFVDGTPLSLPLTIVADSNDQFKLDGDSFTILADTYMTAADFAEGVQGAILDGSDPETTFEAIALVTANVDDSLHFVSVAQGDYDAVFAAGDNDALADMGLTDGVSAFDHGFLCEVVSGIAGEVTRIFCDARQCQVVAIGAGASTVTLRTARIFN